jgi:formylglycine-generating enzyme required for sulfatase activity
LSAARIRQVQEMLIELGFEPGEPDGVLGARTRAAIIAFQHSIGEAATGELTGAEELQLALAYADRPPAPTSSPTAGPTSPFRDCEDCPEMVVIPAGRFLMGSPENEEGRDADESPQHEVTISAPFALGKYEVTRGEFARFVEATGHEAKSCYYWDGDSWEEDAARDWRNPGYEQTDAHPVTCVGFEDAQAYIGWLGQESGESYRLPSEAEWEYAARGGTTTRYSWGDAAESACGHANGHDETSKRVNGFDWESFSCDDGFAQTAPVGTFIANRYGLHDMSGNLWEWVEDRYHDNYEGALSEGSPWLEGTNSARVLRGGSWFIYPRFLRSADRNRVGPVIRDYNIGFRVARTLTP